MLDQSGAYTLGLLKLAYMPLSIYISTYIGQIKINKDIQCSILTRLISSKNFISTRKIDLIVTPVLRWLLSFLTLVCLLS